MYQQKKLFGKIRSQTWVNHFAEISRIKVFPFFKGVHFPPAIAKTFCKVLKCSTFLLKVSPRVLGQCNTFEYPQGGDKQNLLWMRSSKTSNALAKPSGAGHKTKKLAPSFCSRQWGSLSENSPPSDRSLQLMILSHLKCWFLNLLISLVGKLQE